MDTFLLKSKVKIPPKPYRAVRRVRLIEAVEGNVPFFKLLLISAPAGYGKTTLLTQWAHSSRCQVAWLSLDPEDNDLERFLRYLLAAWDQVQPGVSESSLGLLLGGLSPDKEAVLPAFVNAASEAPEPVVFVLDDYHLIEEEAIHRALTFLLDHLPGTLHFVLACRGEPPLPVARYRAHGEMLELGAADLQFLPEETRTFLNDNMGLALTNAEIDPLQTGTEGWIAGLQLAALSLSQRQIKAGKPLVSGRQRFIADYLNEDVLAYLPDELSDFLLQTSILDRLCAPLCETVAGVKDGQQMLETLERENLFLMPLDDGREWYRYHRLFADFLHQELKRRHPEAVPELHQRAARWYLSHDLPEQAFQHAVESQSAELVTQIIDRYFVAKLMGGDVVVVKGWLESLPADWADQYPVIGLARAGILLVTGQFDACNRYLDEVEQMALTKSEHPDLHRGRVMSMRCNIACFQNDLNRAQALADQALRILSEDDLDFLAGIYGSLGDTYRRNGFWQEAKNSYLKLLDFTETPGFHVQAVHVYGALADLDLRQGHLRKAAGYWKKALAALRPRESWGNVPLPLAGWVYIRMGEILYEWNELDDAWDHLSRGLKRAELGGDVRSLIAGYLITSRLKLAEGGLDAAEAYLEKARPHLEDAQFSHWNSRFERFQLELWLAQDRLRTAVQWSDEMLQDEALQGRPESEFTQLAVARVLIVKGDLPSLGKAQALIRSLIRKAETEGRSGILIEALALQALAYQRRGDLSGELKSLEHAFRLAEPEGYLRLFLDLGPAMARLLQEARSREVMPDYADRLLSAFGDASYLPSFAAGALPEPLTSREVEVLKLIAAGLSNREIAGELVISPETVKKHAGNIYGKLGVGSRTEAAARARELDLLD